MCVWWSYDGWSHDRMMILYSNQLVDGLVDSLIHWLIHSIPLRKNIGYSFCDRLDHDSICILHDDDWMRSTTYSLRIKGWIRLSKKQIMIMNSNWIVIQVWLDILPSFLLDLYRYILVYFDWIWIIIWNSYRFDPSWFESCIINHKSIFIIHKLWIIIHQIYQNNPSTLNHSISPFN